MRSLQKREICLWNLALAGGDCTDLGEGLASVADRYDRFRPPASQPEKKG